MGSNRRLAVFVTVLFVVLGVVLGVNVLKPHKPTRSYTPATVNVKNAWLHNDAVYFYTTSFFARYNLGSNTVDQLSDYLNIESGIAYPSWTDRAVVFQTNPTASDRDDITTAAGNLGSPDHRPHWWRYDFTDHQYQLLAMSGIDDCNTLSQINDTSFVCNKPQTPGSFGTQLSVYTLGSAAPKVLTESDDTIGDITVQDSTIYYTTTSLGGKQALHSVPVDSSNPKDLYKAEHGLSYFAYPNGVVLVNELSTNASVGDEGHESESTPSKTNQKLVLLNGTAVEFTKKIKSFPLHLYSSTRNTPLFSSTDGSISTIEDDTIKVLSPATKNQLKVDDFLFKSGERYFVLSKNGNLSSSPAVEGRDNFRKASGFDVGRDNVSSGDSYIDRPEGGTSKAYLYRTDLSSSEQEKLIGDHLTHIGYRPSEFNLQWVVDSIDIQVPIKPNAAAIQ